MVIRVLFLMVCIVSIQCKVLKLTCDQIRHIVDGHNSRRLQLVRGEIPGQPAAAEMKYMVWDEQLKKKAENWARTLRVGKHNPNKLDRARRFRTGENLGWFKYTNKNYEPDVIEMSLTGWFDEHKDYKYGKMSRRDFIGPKIGHYTQMAWANTVYIGCAISKFEEGRWNKFKFVCNYGPTGNIFGFPPYKTGKAGMNLTCTVGNCDHLYGKSCR